MKRKIISVVAAAVFFASCFFFTAGAEEINEGCDLAVDVQSRTEALLQGGTIDPIERVLFVEKTYESDFFSADLIPYMICETHGLSCEVKNKCTYKNLKLSFTQNGDYLDFSFGLKNYESWNAIQVTVKPTEAAKSAKLPARIRQFLVAVF